MAEEIDQAVEKAANVDEGSETSSADIQDAVEDVAGQVAKLPVAQKVLGVAKDVAEEVEKSPMAARVIERVKSTAEEVDKSEFAAQVRKAVKETAEGIEKSPLLAAAHRVLLAGIGAVVLAQEEIEDFVNRLVERGEIAEADGKKMLKDVLEKRKSALEKATKLVESPKRATDDVEQRVEEVLTKMNVPSKDEIETLSAKITALTKKVDELKRQP